MALSKKDKYHVAGTCCLVVGFCLMGVVTGLKGFIICLFIVAVLGAIFSFGIAADIRD